VRQGPDVFFLLHEILVNMQNSKHTFISMLLRLHR